MALQVYNLDYLIGMMPIVCFGWQNRPSSAPRQSEQTWKSSRLLNRIDPIRLLHHKLQIPLISTAAFPSITWHDDRALLPLMLLRPTFHRASTPLSRLSRSTFSATATMPLRAKVTNPAFASRVCRVHGSIWLKKHVSNCNWLSRCLRARVLRRTLPSTLTMSFFTLPTDCDWSNSTDPRNWILSMARCANRLFPDFWYDTQSSCVHVRWWWWDKC